MASGNKPEASVLNKKENVRGVDVSGHFHYTFSILRVFRALLLAETLQF